MISQARNVILLAVIILKRIGASDNAQQMPNDGKPFTNRIEDRERKREKQNILMEIAWTSVISGFDLSFNMHEIIFEKRLTDLTKKWKKKLRQF